MNTRFFSPIILFGILPVSSAIYTKICFLFPFSIFFKYSSFRLLFSNLLLKTSTTTSIPLLFNSSKILSLDNL
ncbi:Hypothetical protein, secreted [Salinibacter ruber M8]|uniref:Uncharacterized protein n=1 Tax=Salinibacter ruber (strain M8) TaxID=761659 RepID=D5H571_SALRM|nr:Hypothetical protein, secreted [Salinibacter ruber M8]